MSVDGQERRVALVTGAGRGMGRGIAERLGQDGHRVVIVDLSIEDAESTAAAVQEAGGDALGVQGDVTDSASVRAAVAAAESQFGPVDILVNCAGWDALMPFVDTDEELWHRLLEINFVGPLRFAHAVLPGMAERGWGRVVNVASDAGRVGSMQESVYSGAKGGLIAFTKTIAREFARRGVTANSVCPGPTDTPGLREAVAESGEGVIAAMSKGVPMRRLGRPEDVASAVSYFARADAEYVTGQTLSVSGGLTMA